MSLRSLEEDLDFERYDWPVIHWIEDRDYPPKDRDGINFSCTILIFGLHEQDHLKWGSGHFSIRTGNFISHETEQPMKTVICWMFMPPPIRYKEIYEL